MFVRFRKVPNDGFEPPAARDGVASFTWERRRPRSRRHWVIGEEKLVPFRIKVMLIENRRVAGKVKQELVAVLGSIDTTWLESFWARMPDLGLRHQKWELGSLRRRTAFWEGVLARMGQIGDNRLSKDDRVAIRRAIHNVVPWVMEPERKRLAVLEARAEYDEFKMFHDWAERDVRHDKEQIARYTAELKKDEAKSGELAHALLQAGLAIAELDREAASS